MYEQHLIATQNGVTNIDVEINESQSRQTDTENATVSESDNGDTIRVTNPTVAVTVEFAIMTDAVATVTVYGSGRVSPAFGGTGHTQTEVKEYMEHAVSIYRAITGDNDTTFTVKKTERIDA